MAVLHQEWLNQNSYRAYPIKETVSRYAVDGSGNHLPDIQIPNCMLVDFVLTVAGTVVRVYISQIAYIGQFLSLEFRDTDGVQVATVAVNIADHTAFDRYPIVGIDDYEDARGVAVFGDLTKLADVFPQGNFQFNASTAE